VKVRRLSDKHLKGGRGGNTFLANNISEKKLKVKKKKKSSLWKERKKESSLFENESVRCLHLVESILNIFLN
jgi:hypothetical protein